VVQIIYGVSTEVILRDHGGNASSRVRADFGVALSPARLTRLAEPPVDRAVADVIERLGRLAGDVVAPALPAHESVPDWLASRLIHTVGMTPQDVAALSLEEAVDRWGNYMSKPPGEIQDD
jgi:mRNA interferase RelE/StbE